MTATTTLAAAAELVEGVMTPSTNAGLPLTLLRLMRDVAVEVGPVEKRGRNEAGDYSYVRAEDVIAHVREPLLDRNIMLVEQVEDSRDKAYTVAGGAGSLITTVRMSFLFVHVETGEQLLVRWQGRGDDPGDKGLSKAYTQAIKTVLNATFLLGFGDDPEADAATDARGRTREPEPEPPAGDTGRTPVAEDGGRPAAEGLVRAVMDAHRDRASADAVHAWITENSDVPHDGASVRSRVTDLDHDTATRLLRWLNDQPAKRRRAS